MSEPERLIAFEWSAALGSWGILNGDTAIATVSHDTPTENERRARLFAAAPELLAACEALLCKLDETGGEDLPGNWIAPWSAALAAVAKARGEAADAPPE